MPPTVPPSTKVSEGLTLAVASALVYASLKSLSVEETAHELDCLKPVSCRFGSRNAWREVYERNGQGSLLLLLMMAVQSHVLTSMS